VYSIKLEIGLAKDFFKDWDPTLWGKVLVSDIDIEMKSVTTGQEKTFDDSYLVFFLVDAADDDIDDQTLRFQNTLSGNQRRAVIEVPESVTVTPGPGNSGDIGYFKDGNRITLTYTAPEVVGTDTFLKSTGKLTIAHFTSGAIASIDIEGRATSRQNLFIDTATLKQVLRDEISRLLDPMVSEIGFENALGALTVVDQSGARAIDDKAIDQIVRQVEQRVVNLYAPVARVEDQLGGKAFEVRRGVPGGQDIETSAVVSYKIAGGASTARGVANLDMSFAQLKKLFDLANADPAEFSIYDRTPAGQLFIIDELMNRYRRAGEGAMPVTNPTDSASVGRKTVVYLDNIMKESSGAVSSSAQFISEFAHRIGNTAAHEAGHSFGLLDQYFSSSSLTPEQQMVFDEIVNSGRRSEFSSLVREASLMGNQRARDISSIQLSLLYLAFDSPLQQSKIDLNDVPQLVTYMRNIIDLNRLLYPSVIGTAISSKGNDASDQRSANARMIEIQPASPGIRSEFKPATVSTADGADVIGPILAKVDQSIPVSITGGGAATEILTFFEDPESRFSDKRSVSAFVNGKDLVDSTDRTFGVLGWDARGFLVLQGSAPVIVQDSLDIDLEISIPTVEGGRFQEVEDVRFIQGGGAGSVTFSLNVTDMPHPDLYLDDFELYLGANAAPIALSSMTLSPSQSVGAQLSFQFNPEILGEITDVYLRVIGSTEAYSDTETINVIEVPSWLNDTAGGSVQYDTSSASYTINGTVPGQLQYDVPEGDLPGLDYLQYLFPDRNFDTKIEVGARVKVTAPVSLFRSPDIEATNVTAEIKVLGLGLVERSVTPLNLNQGRTQVSGRLNPLTLDPASFAVVHGPVNMLDQSIQLLDLSLGVEGPSIPLVVGGVPVPVGEAGFGLDVALSASLEKADLTFGFGLNFVDGAVVVSSEDTFIRLESQLKAAATGVANFEASVFGAVEGEVEVGAKVGVQIDILFEPHYGAPNANPNSGYAFSIDEKSNARISAAYGLWVIGRADLFFFGEVETPALTIGPNYFELSTSDVADDEGTVLLYPDRPLDLVIPTAEALVGELPPAVDDVAKEFAGESSDDQDAVEAAAAFRREMNQIGDLTGRDESEIDALLRSRGYTFDQAPIDGEFGPTRVFTTPLLNENGEATGYTLGIRVDPNPVGYSKRPEPEGYADERTNWHGHIEIIPSSALNENNNYHYTSPVAYFNGSAEYITKEQFDSFDDYAKEQHIILEGPPPPHSPIIPAAPEDTDESSERGLDVQDSENLDAESLANFVRVAESSWREKVGHLPTLDIEFGVAALPDNQLAYAQVIDYDADNNRVTGRLVIDDDGTGSGWFIDNTPAFDEEFTVTGDPFSLAAKRDVSSSYDLLTVINHEVGHLLGFSSVFPGFSDRVLASSDGLVFVGDGYEASLDSGGHHLSRAAYGNDLMSTNIPIGVRRSPSDLAAAILRDSRISLADDVAEETDSSSDAPIAVELDPLIIPKFVLLAEQLEESLENDPPTSVRNGTFDEGQPGSNEFAWKQIGAVAYADGVATLSEGNLLFTDLSQTFILPEGSKDLSFTVSGLNLNSNAGGMLPPDAFEVALLDALDLTPVGGALQGLDFTDALLNIQPDGTVRMSSRVTINGPTDGSGPFTVKVNVAGLAADRAVTLYFDLIRFGETGSAVSVSDVTLTIGISEAAPTAEQPVINGGADQRSMVREISVQFDQNVSGSLEAGDLMLENLTTGEVMETGVALAFDPETLTATWTFSGLTGGSLPDGNYRATLFGAGISNATGTLLDGDGDGNPGGDLHVDFHRYFGDSDGDRDVDFADTYAYQRTHFKIATDPDYDDTFDWDHDGDIDALDLFQFRKRYLTKLDPEPIPAEFVAAESALSEESTAATSDVQGNGQPQAGHDFSQVTENPAGNQTVPGSESKETTTVPALESAQMPQHPWPSPFDLSYGFGLGDSATSANAADEDEETPWQASNTQSDPEAEGLLIAITGVLESQ